MAIKDSATEDLIKETAKRLFFAEGKFHATTQEIAEAAGVNRTLVHYYFRSRDFLFDQILAEAFLKIEERMEIFFDPEMNFRKKVETFIDFYLDEAMRFPYLDTYVVSRINDGLPGQKERFNDNTSKAKIKALFGHIEEAMQKKQILKSEPIQFFLNLFSLLAHPVALQPMYKMAFELSDKQYKKLLKDRREIILKLLFTS